MQHHGHFFHGVRHLFGESGRMTWLYPAHRISKYEPDSIGAGIDGNLHMLLAA
jgi:hypothetical protein